MDFDKRLEKENDKLSATNIFGDGGTSTIKFLMDTVTSYETEANYNTNTL